MKKSVKFVILICSILVCGFIGGYLGVKFADFTDKVMSNEVEIDIYVEDVYNKKVEFSTKIGDSDYTYSKQIILPKISIETDNVKKLNEKIYSKYESDIKNINNEMQEGTRLEIDINYDYIVKNEIIYITIKRGEAVLGDGFYTYDAYYYDIQNDKELTLTDVMSKSNITTEKVKNINKDVKDVVALMPTSLKDSFRVYYSQVENCESVRCDVTLYLDV